MSVPMDEWQLEAWLAEAVEVIDIDYIFLSNEDALAVEESLRYGVVDGVRCMAFRGIRCHASHSIVVGRPLAIPVLTDRQAPIAVEYVVQCEALS